MAKSPLNSIIQGDCVAEMLRLKKAGVRPQLIFADPPFNIGYEYDEYNDKRSSNEYLEWSRKWIEAASDLLDDNGSLWIAIGDEYAAELKTIADSCGLNLRNWIIWYYTFGVHCVTKFTRSHTHIFYFVKDPKNFTFNDHSIRVPSARQLVYADSRADRQGRIPDNTWILRPQDVGADWENSHDTWYVPRVAGTFKQRAGFHGCQMPERLLGRIIQAASNEQDLVLDPFSGSGTTVSAAKKLGRNFIGLELSTEYVRLSQARLEQIRPGDELDGPEDPLSSAPPTTRRSSGKMKLEKQHDDAVLNAFQKVSSGFSADRIIADPVINSMYLEECSRSGLPGRPVDWNRRLLNLRKTGKLPAETTKRSNTEQQDLDSYLFASEIAMRTLLDMGYQGIDEMLCDPRGALRFDEIARSLAPGFSSFEYRWGAIWLRKRASQWRESAAGVDTDSLKPALTCPLGEVPVPESKQAAAYLLWGHYRKQKQIAYAGATVDFGERILRTLAASGSLSQYLPITGDWQIDLFPLSNSSLPEIRGIQSRLIQTYQPRLNLLELADAAELPVVSEQV